MQNKCIICGADLTPDDIGASKKLINRGMDKDFLCVPCLAQKYGVSVELIREKIEYWREGGCMLFAPKCNSGS
jgi:hypothetical protein